MGLRFRKSFNYGGFRVNFSKSGVGYSYGVKGFRYTRLADGRERVTISIPNTGISWVEETSNAKREIDERQQAIDSGNYHTINNADTKDMTPVEYKEFIGACEKHIKDYMLWNALFTCSLVFFGFAFVGALSTSMHILLGLLSILLGVGIYYTYGIRKEIKNNKVKLMYEFDDTPNPYSDLIEVIGTNHSQMIQCATSYISNAKQRVHAGASSLYDLSRVILQRKNPDFIDTNIECYYIKLPYEDLYILPDKLLFVKGKVQVGAVGLDSLQIQYSESNFRETGTVASDSTQIGTTYQYVNNNGTPDRRYKDNRTIPILKYGRLDITSPDGINMVFFCSNPYCTELFYNRWLKKTKTESSTPNETKNNKNTYQSRENLPEKDFMGIRQMLSNKQLGESIYLGDENERYLLGVYGQKTIIFFGVNSSTATNDVDDPTIRNIKKIALENDCDGWLMLNLYPQRDKNPDMLHEVVNEELVNKNTEIIKAVFEHFRYAQTVAMWGDLILKRDYLKDCLVKILDLDYDRMWYCRGELTKANNPRHQLYVANNTPLKELIFDADGNVLGAYDI